VEVRIILKLILMKWVEWKCGLDHGNETPHSLNECVNACPPER